jgi:hypothetical protein
LRKNQAGKIKEIYMGWRFRKSFKILPGIKLNFGKRGYTSTTIGKGFFKTNLSKKGVRHTVSIPGTGLSYQTKTQSYQNKQTGNSPVALHWYCKTCHTQNLPDSQFCSNCGGVYNPSPQQLSQNATYRTAPVLIGVGIFLLVGFTGLFLLVGLIAAFSPKTSSSQSISTPTPARFTATPEQQLNSIPPKETINQKERLKTASAASATVITENANLRQTPNQNGEVLQTIPLDSSVEVIKQNGAWFFVAFGAAKGWMHGNTIRYDNQVNSLRENPSIPKSDPRSNNDDKPTIQKPDSSGASAKCADGTLSYSASRRGTCSHHGGVAMWY